jgi:hypothetical protein
MNNDYSLWNPQVSRPSTNSTQNLYMLGCERSQIPHIGHSRQKDIYFLLLALFMWTVNRKRSKLAPSPKIRSFRRRTFFSAYLPCEFLTSGLSVRAAQALAKRRRELLGLWCTNRAWREDRLQDVVSRVQLNLRWKHKEKIILSAQYYGSRRNHQLVCYRARQRYYYQPWGVRRIGILSCWAFPEKSLS